MARMVNCPVCQSNLMLSRLECEKCDLILKGNFTLPRLARLQPEYQVLAEQMILCGGNLKDLAEEVGVSYPTLRRKVDDLMSAMKALKASDEAVIASLLDGIQAGTIKAEEGIRKIKEIQGEI